MPQYFYGFTVPNKFQLQHEHDGSQWCFMDKQRNDMHQFKGVGLNGILLYWKHISCPFFKTPRDSWAGHYSPGSCFVSSVQKCCHRKPRQRHVIGERKVVRLQREPTSQENFSTTCLLFSPIVPPVNIHIPLVIIFTYILSQQFIPRASVRLSIIPPILLFNTFFEEMSSKQDRKNPEYDPWRKNKRVKKDWRSGTLQRWQEPGLVQPPAEKQLSFSGFPYDSMLCPTSRTPSQHPPHWLSRPSEIRHLAAGSCYLEVCGGVFPQEDSFQWHFWSASLLSPNLYSSSGTCHSFSKSIVSSSVGKC